jgi:hypothetical protein
VIVFHDLSVFVPVGHDICQYGMCLPSPVLRNALTFHVSAADHAGLGVRDRFAFRRQFDRRHHVAETLRKGSRVTGSARERLAADLKKKYSQGRSIRALAEETGRSYGFVHRMLTESGVTLRGRGGATRGKVKA